MNPKRYFYLLAEEGGWDCSSYAFSYRDQIVNSSAYRILQINVLECRKYPTSSAKRIAKDFDNLYLEPLTVKDTFVLERQINYLALHSFPAFYLNPLAIDPNYNGEVSSIGDLRFTLEGKERTLNEIILDKNSTIDRKKHDVNNKLEFFLKDRNGLVLESISQLKKQTSSDKKERKRRIRRISDFVYCAILNLLQLFFFLYPNEIFRRGILTPTKSNPFAYIGWMYFLILFLYDFCFLLFHSYRSRIYEPYNYARRFLKKNQEKLFQDIQDEKDKLYAYISLAITNHVTLKNDIKDFSKLSSSYIDFKSVNEVSAKANGRFYKIRHTLKNSFATLAGILCLILFTLFLISVNHGGTL